MGKWGFGDLKRAAGGNENQPAKVSFSNISLRDEKPTGAQARKAV